MISIKSIYKKVKGRELFLLTFIVILVAVLSITTVSFFTWPNLKDILLNVSYVIVAGAGMTMVIITGNIDVSLGAMLAALSLTMGQMAKAGVPMLVYCLLTILMGIVLGGIAGLLIGRCKVSAIICTLGLSNIYRGMIVVITNGEWVQELPESFNAIGKGEIFDIPIPIIIAITVALLLNWYMKNTRMGRSIYAAGSNASAAELSGITVKNVILVVYMFMGGLMGIASIIHSTRFVTIQSNTGANFEMLAIAAAIVGGTDIYGGTGRIIGTMLGAILLGIIRTGLVLLRISTYWEQCIQGLIILIAVIVGLYSHYIKHRKKSA